MESKTGDVCSSNSDSNSENMLFDASNLRSGLAGGDELFKYRCPKREGGKIEKGKRMRSENKKNAGIASVQICVHYLNDNEARLAVHIKSV